MADKFDNAPNCKSYFALLGKHEFDLECQRDILLHFIKDNQLDDVFFEYLDKHFPENGDGVRGRKQ